MIRTRLTRRFNLTHSIVLAPMAKVGGGALAAAVSRAGGLGVIGGGYCEPDWISEQFDLAGGAEIGTEIGCGFITWRLAQETGLRKDTVAHAAWLEALVSGDVDIASTTAGQGNGMERDDFPRQTGGGNYRKHRGGGRGVVARGHGTFGGIDVH